jgi:hypothetical protein
VEKISFEKILTEITDRLALMAKAKLFVNSKEFEDSVREVTEEVISRFGLKVNFDSAAQAFPDIALGEFGIEVKFTEKDTWRSVANSVLETNRDMNVKHVYLVFGKMGGIPDVKWADYESSVIHVRTSHVPRFEVEIGSEKSLFAQLGISYDEFRTSDMHSKMQYIRKYARSRLKPGERMWWIEDQSGEQHSVPIQARLYTKLSMEEKIRLRAEAVLLCPSIVSSGRSRTKYDDVVLYLLTYHGVLCHQARDLFSAGSVANPNNDNLGGIYIERALKLIEHHIFKAAHEMDDALFEEYWGLVVPRQNRIREWLRRADASAKDWKPSDSLFIDYDY